MRLSFILLTAFFISCSEISHNSAEWQIETYSSAAPSYIGDFATVIGGRTAMGIYFKKKFSKRPPPGVIVEIVSQKRFSQ